MGKALQWAIVGLILLVLAAIVVPNYRRTSDRAPRRACFANQKTIAGAVEMYNLDNNTSIRELSPEVFTTLIEKGYLQSRPTDPGLGPESGAHYQLLASGDVVCLVHGFIQPPQGTTLANSAQEQLEAAGAHELAARASVLPQPSTTYRSSSYWQQREAAWLLAVFFLSCAVGSLVRALLQAGAAAVNALSLDDGRGVTRRPSQRRTAPALEPEDVSGEPDITFLGPVYLATEAARCPVCGDELNDEPTVRCHDCNTPHHAACWEYTGGCATFACACRRSSAIRPPRAPRLTAAAPLAGAGAC